MGPESNFDILIYMHASAPSFKKPPLTRSEIVALLSGADSRALFQTADDVRRQFVGDAVYLRGLIEFSNYCKNDCI